MSRPLDGISVLDLGQIYQGGYCGLLLSYLGADVVKVEPPWGENVRTRSEDGKPPQVQFLNANKRGITLDLKSAAGREALVDLAAEADVLLENFATGKMDELGVGYDTLSEANPELVYAHGSGYGDSGPYADYPAMDLTVQAMSGLIHTTGFPDGDPVKAGPAVCDFLGAVHLALGITSALFERSRTGEGRYVEVGMYDCMYPTLASPVSAHVSRSDAPPRTGNQHSGLAIAPYNVYPTDEGYVAIICISERHWEALATRIGREDLVGVEGYDSKSARAERRETVDDAVTAWLDGRRTDEVVDQLLGDGVPCAPVQTVEDVIDDEHLEDRGMIHRLPNQGEGRSEVPVPGMPIKFAGVAEPTVEQAPLLGEHTEEVLAEIAGYGPEELERLRTET
ncbi:CaiB/BaiF CoA transferase family protein [Halorubrum sp. DTA46]|uniref:CaiB/BaiF CoA transferase family protein n=1 Tax=Halorubrum sp. DTA46 TaxID=3402162 RepID=UPI003AB01A6B